MNRLSRDRFKMLKPSSSWWRSGGYNGVKSGGIGICSRRMRLSVGFYRVNKRMSLTCNRVYRFNSLASRSHYSLFKELKPRSHNMLDQWCCDSLCRRLKLRLYHTVQTYHFYYSFVKLRPQLQRNMVSEETPCSPCWLNWLLFLLQAHFPMMDVWRYLSFLIVDSITTHGPLPVVHWVGWVLLLTD